MLYKTFLKKICPNLKAICANFEGLVFETPISYFIIIQIFIDMNLFSHLFLPLVNNLVVIYVKR